MVDKIVEENTETAIGMTVMTEAGTRLEKGHFPEIKSAIELDVQSIVDPGQDPQQVQTGIEFNVLSIGNMIILQGIIPLLGKRKR